MEKIKLKLDFCSYEAANYSVLNWHYSKCMPAGKSVKIGVWENEVFIGTIIYSYGANNNLAKSFNLKQTECVELTRVALNKHLTPVSKLLSISIKLLRKLCPNLKLIASYADLTNQNHFGVIYQASNFICLGTRKAKGAAYYIINGKKMHGRSVRAKWGNEKNIPFKWKYADEQEKFLYVFLLDKVKMNWLIDKKQKNPKRVQSIDSDASFYQKE